MPAAADVAVFALAALVFAAIPGPAVVYIVTRSVSQGRRAGVVSALGIATGTLGHVLAAALGLSALLATSALAFSVVKYLGAAYLVVLGIRHILRRDEPDAAIVPTRARRHGRIFRQGVVVAVLNPKTALFFLAFLPQFVDPAQGSELAQILFLGSLLVVIGAASDSTYALVAGTVGRLVRRRGRPARRRHVVAGGIHIALGVSAAVAGSGPDGS